MLLKPIIEVKEESIKSLPCKTQESEIPHLAPMSEYKESLELHGRLLMLSLLNLENSLFRNKEIHDKWTHGRNERAIYGVNIWPVCPCNFAESIRNQDIGLAGLNVNDLMKGR